MVTFSGGLIRQFKSDIAHPQRTSSICGRRLTTTARTRPPKPDNHLALCRAKLAVFDIRRAPITMAPPAMAHCPGSSPITAQTRIGAKTDSSRTSSTTSDDRIWRRLKAKRQDAGPMNAPCARKSGHCGAKLSKGATNVPKTQAASI